MKRIHFIIGFLCVILVALAIFFVLRDKNTLIAHPKGVVAHNELQVIIRNILLMLLVVGPTLILLFAAAWRYHAKNTKGKYDPEQANTVLGQLVLWIIPSIIIAVMGVLTWYDAHELDPYQPIKSDEKPLTIQVVALDWKWLFIYPEQGIATLNFVQFPAQRPVHFALAADGSPMNSFWIPQLSGQVYAMTGMVTPLHLMANEPGEYRGHAAEINGEGYASMTFIAKSTAQPDFDKWVANVKQSPLKLSNSAYDELVKHSENHSVLLYSSVEKNLFHTIVSKYYPYMKASQ